MNDKEYIQELEEENLVQKSNLMIAAIKLGIVSMYVDGILQVGDFTKIKRIKEILDYSKEELLETEEFKSFREGLKDAQTHN